MVTGGEDNKDLFTFGDFADVREDYITLDDSELDDPINIKAPEIKAQEKKVDEKEVKKVKEDDNKLILIPDKDESSEEVLPSGDEEIDEEQAQSSSPSLYKAFAKALSNEGLFPHFSDEEFEEWEKETGSSMGALLKLQEIQKGEVEKEFVAKLSPAEQKEYEMSKQGVNIQKYKAVKADQAQLGQITEESIEEDEALQEQLVQYYYRLRGFGEDEITENIELLKDTGKLQNSAKVAKTKVKEILDTQEVQLVTEAQEEQKKQEEERQSRLVKTKQFIDGLNEVVTGVQLNKKVKDDVYTSITTPVARDEQGRYIDAVTQTRNKNPMAFNVLMHYYHQLGLFNMDENGVPKPDWSKIINTVRTKKVDGEFEKLLARETGGFTKSHKGTPTKKTNSMLGDEFKL